MALRSHSLLLVCIFILITRATAEAPIFLYNFCINYRGNYTNNSDYKVNLNTLLSSLPTGNGNGHGFYNLSRRTGVEKVNGIVLCRGDVEVEACGNCINIATKALPQLCPNQKEAVVWYDLCMLRYSNRSLYGVLESSPTLYMQNTNNVSSYVQNFTHDLRGLLDGLKNRASSGGSLQKFATGNVDSVDFNTIYGLVQCTPDLSRQDCTNCLDEAFRNLKSCCDGKIGGRVIYPSCNFRFETYLFYEPTPNATLDASPPRSSLPPPSPTNTTSTEGINLDNQIEH